MGKTALLRRFLGGMGPRLLQASGEELERIIPYGVLDQLVAASGMPPPPGVTGLTARTTMDPVAAGLGVAELLAAMQDDGLVAVVLDDAQWADEPSLQALVFALRRLQADRVLAIISARDDDDARLPDSLHRLVDSERGSRLRLGGLEVPDLRVLAASLGLGMLSPGMAERVRDHTGGNPLYARAVLEELPADALLDPDVPLPCPRSFTLLVLARLAGCPAEAQQLVVAAAVLGTPCPLHLADGLARAGNPLLALEQAMAARLLVAREASGGWTIDFPHPLVRAAVYHDLGPAPSTPARPAWWRTRSPRCATRWRPPRARTAPSPTR